MATLNNSLGFQPYARRIWYQWLVRLVFGLIYYFGIKQGVGAESLSEFIQAIHLDTHVASSASTLRQLKHRVNQC